MKTLRDQLIESHGEVLGAMIHDAQVADRTKRAERYTQLRAELSQVQSTIDAQRRGAAKRQAPLQAAMDRAYQTWLESCEALEAQRLADERALMPLQERVGALVREITADPNAARVSQWTKLSETEMPQLQAS